MVGSMVGHGRPSWGGWGGLAAPGGVGHAGATWGTPAAARQAKLQAATPQQPPPSSHPPAATPQQPPPSSHSHAALVKQGGGGESVRLVASRAPPRCGGAATPGSAGAAADGGREGVVHAVAGARGGRRARHEALRPY